MLKRNWKKVLKSRKTVWMLFFCLMAGAVCGTVYKNSRLEKDIENTAVSDSAADDEQLQARKDADTGYVQEDPADMESETNGGASEKSDQIQANAGEKADAGEQKDDNGSSSDTEEAAPAASIIKTDNLDFLTDSRLEWPVEGEVLMEFNMDETVYFPTLNLYKCSQGMVIQAEEGTPVCAPAEGVVVSIGMDEQIGNYLVLDIGDGYQVKMGQLKDIEVSEGAQVKEGDLLAYIASPTKCYSVEGDNLYLELTENGTPVDPLDYLNY